MSKLQIRSLLIIGVLLTGCGSASSTTSSSSAGTSSALTISPTSVSLTEGEASTFTTSGGSGSYTYSVSTDGTTSTGTVTSAGYYVAPTGWTGTTYLIVQDTDGNTNYATITVTSTSSTGSTGSTGSTLEISPSSMTLLEGATYTFAASGGVGTYTYSIESGSGSIDSSTGFYTAPSNATGETIIMVTDQDDEESFATVTITASSGSTTTTSYPTQPLYRDYDSKTAMHWSTLSSGAVASGYTVDGEIVATYTGQPGSTYVQLYECSWLGGRAHFTTTSFTCEGASGATLSAELGWIDTVQGSGEVPLYRWFAKSTDDHFISTSQTEGTFAGYVLEEIIGYAPAP
jgi:hypothetical protein